MTTHLIDRPRRSNITTPSPRGTSLWRTVAWLVSCGHSRTDVLHVCTRGQTEIVLTYLDALLGEV